MAEAKSQQRGAHTSALLAMLANAHRDPRKARAFKPADFNPHLRRKEPPAARVGIGVLKQVFVDRFDRGMKTMTSVQKTCSMLPTP